MHSNQFDSMILGAIQLGQGSINAVEGTHRTLRTLIAKVARRYSMRLGSWRALSVKRTAAWRATPGRVPTGWVAVVPATCPSDSDARRQRRQRWMSGVVATRGAVGVC
jgi:hypothetical protein